MAEASGFNLLGPGVSVKAVIVEFFGMAMFILISTGTATGLSEFAVDADGNFVSGNQVIETAFAFGMSILVLAYATAHTSGGQFNPAVTLGLMTVGSIPMAQGICNIVAQIIGAILGSGLLYGIVPDDKAADLTLGANAVPSGIQTGSALLGEACGTFALVFVVLECACNPKSMAGASAPIPIGFTVFVIHLLLIPFTSCGINPARSLGPAIVSDFWGPKFWVFMLGPLLGAAVAAGFHKFLLHSWDTVQSSVDVGPEYNGELETTLQAIADKLGVSTLQRAAEAEAAASPGKSADTVVQVHLAACKRSNSGDSERGAPMLPMFSLPGEAP